MSALHISRDLSFYEFPNFADKQERLPRKGLQFEGGVGDKTCLISL